MVDTGDLKSLGRIGRAGSSPAAGTTKLRIFIIIKNILAFNGWLVYQLSHICVPFFVSLLM